MSYILDALSKSDAERQREQPPNLKTVHRKPRSTGRNRFNLWQGAILILILGNALVIGLEGLSAGIQALRLSYYEFFTKFFHGTGKLYSPISLSSEH